MSKPTTIALGSTTLVRTGLGHLFGVHVAPIAGGSVIVADLKDAGAGGFDFNTNPAGYIWRTPAYLGATADYIQFPGVKFDTGLTVAATSNTRLTVYTD